MMVSHTTTTTTTTKGHHVLAFIILSIIIRHVASSFLDSTPSATSSSPLTTTRRIRNGFIQPSSSNHGQLLPFTTSTRTNSPKPRSSSSSTPRTNNNQLLHMAAGDVAFAALTDVDKLYDYAPAATSLFNNMKLPAAVVTAGMISLGFATSFPELPANDENYSLELRQFCETLRRVHIVVALISVTSELIAVLWAAVEVNQLTERVFAPTSSVWELIQRDCDLAWSAVNSHFTMGIIGFVAMLSLRAYVMLIAARASKPLMSAALCGTTAALCLMISIVNRGVQAGGGNGVGYGATILDLLQHYAVLLYRAAINYGGGPDPAAAGPGPLQFAAIALEVASIGFVVQVLLTKDGDKEQQFLSEGDAQHVVESPPQTLVEDITPQQPNQPISLGLPKTQPTTPTKNRVSVDTIFPKTKKSKGLFFATNNNNNNNSNKKKGNQNSSPPPSSSLLGDNPLSLIPPPGIRESQNLITATSKRSKSNSNSSPYAAVPSSSSTSTSTSTSSSSSSSPASASSSSSPSSAMSSQQQTLTNGDLASDGGASTGGGTSSAAGISVSSSSSADDMGGGGGSSLPLTQNRMGYPFPLPVTLFLIWEHLTVQESERERERQATNTATCDIPISSGGKGNSEEPMHRDKRLEDGSKRIPT